MPQAARYMCIFSFLRGFMPFRLNTTPYSIPDGSYASSIHFDFIEFDLLNVPFIRPDVIHTSSTMSHAPNVTTRSASRQPALSTPLGDNDSDIETTIHDSQGPVTLETLYQLFSARFDELSARIERLEQARPSPQPHAGNQVVRLPHQTRQDTPLAVSVTNTARPYIHVNSVSNPSPTFLASTPASSPAKRPSMVTIYTRGKESGSADRTTHLCTRVNPADYTTDLYTCLYHFGHQGNILNALKNWFRVPDTLHGRRNGQTVGCAHQVFDPGGTYI
jgi:hypothetical protein